MGGNKLRDGILLGVVVLLALLILLPDRDSNKDGSDDSGGGYSSGLFDSEGSKANGKPAEDKPTVLGVPVDRSGASPIEGVPHVYMPLVPGTEWIYKVRGPELFVPNETWTLKLLTAPEGEEPGKLEAGFGEEREEAKVWLEGETLRFDGLPLMEPIEFLGNRPRKVNGVFLPAPAQVGEDAVWIMDFERDVIYQYIDKRGKSHSMPAKAKERVRATAREQEMIITSAGQFNAWKISWVSRIEILAKGRPVLQELTAEPFRRETMWIAPGIGIVRRMIDYTAHRAEQVSFDLVDFSYVAQREAKE